jgi:RNA polymerase sigma-70 factor (ECF subfamily)
LGLKNKIVATLFQEYTDFEIIDKVVAGETKLFEVLIRRNNAALYKIGRSYRYNHQDTEDLMQEAYIAAFYSLPKFEKRSSFKTWLSRVMINLCYQKKQRSSFKNEIPLENNEGKIVPMFQQHPTMETPVNKELGRVLENAINKIPEDYRIVFTLRELNGLSISETIEALQISESNVKVRLNRAKKLLRAEVEKMYTPEDIFEFNLVYCDRMVQNVMNKILN